MKRFATLFFALGASALLALAPSCSDEGDKNENPVNPPSNGIIPNNGVGADGKIHLDTSFGGIYFGDFWDIGYGDYYIMLTNDEVGLTGNGDAAPMHQGGWILYLDFWGGLSVDHTNPILPEGTYTFASERGANVLTAGYTLATNNYEQVEVDGEILYRVTDVLFSGGTATVTHTAKGYRIEANMLNVADQPLDFVYEGEIQFEDKSDDEEFSVSINWDVDLQPKRAFTYKSQSYENCDNHVITLFDVESISSDGVHPAEPGMKLQLDIYTEPGGGIAGTYRVGELSDKGILDKQPGVYYPGRYWGGIALGSFLEYLAEDYTTVLYSVIYDGELTITANEDGTHTIQADFTSETGNKVTCNWTGRVEDRTLSAQ